MAAIAWGISASVSVSDVPPFARIASAMATSLSVSAILDHLQFRVDQGIDVSIRHGARNIHRHDLPLLVNFQHIRRHCNYVTFVSGTIR